VLINVNEEFAQAVQSSTFQVAHFGVRRPVGALVGCDLSQPAHVEFTLTETRRQVAADQSG